MAWQARSIKDIRDSSENELEDFNSNIRSNLSIIKGFNDILKSKSMGIAISNIENALDCYNKSTLGNLEDLKGTETAISNSVNEIGDSKYDLSLVIEGVR